MQDDNTISDDLRQALDRFLEAFDAFEATGKADGQFIIDQYLLKFQDKDSERADVARDIARSTEREIEQFGIRGAALIGRMSLAAMKGEQSMVGETVESMSAIMEHANREFDAIIDRVQHRQDGSLAPSRESLDEKLAQARAKSTKAVRDVITVADLGTLVFEMRSLTLREFRQKNLEVSRDEVARRMATILDAMPRDVLFSRLRELGSEILSEYLKKVPVLGWGVWVVQKFRGLWKPKADTKPGDTDIMLKLLPDLKRDVVILDEMNRVYTRLMEDERATAR